MIDKRYETKIREHIRTQMCFGLPVEMSTSVDLSAYRIRFTSIGRDQSGDEVVRIKRTIDLESRQLEGGETFISHRMRGHGHGRQIMKNCYRLSASLNLTRMNIHAVMEGRYAWAKCGFTPTLEHWPSIKKQLISALEKSPFGDHPDQRLLALRITESDSPWSLYLLTRIKEMVECEELSDLAPITFGRALLCRLTGWMGEFDMANERSRALLFGELK